VGNNEIGQCNVGDWTDIVQIAVGWGHTVGFRADGTLVAAGYNDYGQCEISGWIDIKRVTAGEYYHTIAGGYGHTVGVRADGTVVAVGHNEDGQCNTYGWTEIVGVAAGNYHTVGLRADGTVLAAGLEVELAKWNLGNVALDLSISSTSGGEVTGPGEGTFPYYPGRELNLIAKPERGYRFVNWTGDVDTIDNVDAAQTTITMNDGYSITANFEEGRPVDWALVGGIVGAVVIAGLVVFFVRRKRSVRKKARGKKASRTKKR
jgi:alpha-tubulin suppressor-like RCC1 family protein